MRYLLCALLLSVAVSASTPAAEKAEYTIQPEDVLTVSVDGHEDLQRDVVVLNDGHFDYPMAGRVDVAGKTPEQAAALITAALKAQIVDPDVTVSVRTPSLRRVYVSGLVGKPGSYDLKPGWRVSHLLAEAGGFTGRIESAKATVVRGDQSIPVDLKAVIGADQRDADIALQPGDLLQVQPDTNLVHIVGQVRSPGDYQLGPGLGVLEAVAMAGGANPTAALSRAQLLRVRQVIPVDLHALLVEGKSDGNVVLLPGDTLVVPANESRIAVLGGVQQPGYFDLPDGKPVTVVDALGLAHGANRRARLNNVSLIRMEGGKQIVKALDIRRFLKEGDVSQNPAVLPGDVVYVTDGSGMEPGNVLTAIASFVSPLLYGAVR
ncbi:MAG TPA: polysaccharide biosynthesis/export family protein [Armatimonadota bacterium]|jgi:polysaccharide export outer membrane protein